MSDAPEEIDDLIVYEFAKDCDSVEDEEFQVLDEQEVEEEAGEIVEEVVADDGAANEFVLPTNVEALDDEDILQEHILQSFDAIPDGDVGDAKLVDLKAEVSDDKVTIETASASKKEGKVKGARDGPQRYLLFDDLIATVVDYDEENTPIVQFGMPETEQDEQLPVECGICPDVMHKSNLAKHLKTHLVPGTNRYQCIYCHETYKDYKYLGSHARRHMGIRPYVCEVCKLYFSTKQDMRVHNQRRHMQKEHICEICGKTFSQNTMLKRHRESTHEKKRRFQCEHCNKAYYKNFSLQEHVRSVHMGQRRMLKCPFCGMQCLDAHKMARHRKLWHLNQKHFECEICQEKFTNVHYFDAHKRSIQCRNNTRRKLEEEQKQPPRNLITVKKTEDLQDESQGAQESQVEPIQPELQWKYEEEESQQIVEEEEVYAIDDQYVEFVVHDQDLIQNGEELFQQDGDMIYEITLDSNETN